MGDGARAEKLAVVGLTREEARALLREASGRSVLHHVQLEDENEHFWAVISGKLQTALEDQSPSGCGTCGGRKEINVVVSRTTGQVLDSDLCPDCCGGDA